MSQMPSEAEMPGESGKALKRLLIGAVIVFLAVIVLAEIGVVRLDSTSTDSSTEHKYEYNTVNWRGLRLSDFRLVPNVSVGEVGAGRAIANEAAEMLRKVPSDGGAGGGARFDISINEMTLEGTPWLPLFRNGSGTYSATYHIGASTGGASIQLHGEVKGKVQQSMKGLSSSGLFRQVMGKAVADGIVGHIQKTIAKNGS